MALPPIRVIAPSIVPPKYGLLDTIASVSGPPQTGLGVEYEAAFCGPARAWEKPCTDTPDPKVADDGISTVTGEPIPIYHLFQCRLVGSASEGEARARQSLDLGASRALEEGFQIVFGTGATDVTPGGTAVSLVDGLALLEQYAGENYGGRPVIHMSRANALRLISLMAVYVVGDHLETALGSIVVAGAGYGGLSQPSAPAAGAGWMYATGAVTIWEGKTIVSPIALQNPYNNEFIALAERTYTPTYECFHAAVEVTEQVTA